MRNCFQPTDVRIRIAAKTVREGACLVFTGHPESESGHRKIFYRGKAAFVHRVVWELTHGPIPDGLCVLHRCDNPPCIELDHLWLGTIADNNRDRDLKGRRTPPRGSENGNARLSEQQVIDIKVRLQAGDSTYKLAADYGVHQSAVWRIKAGRTWTHVELPKAQRDAMLKVTWPKLVTAP